MWAPNPRRAYASQELASQKQNAVHIPSRWELNMSFDSVSANDCFYPFFSLLCSQFFFKFSFVGC